MQQCFAGLRLFFQTSALGLHDGPMSLWLQVVLKGVGSDGLVG